MSKSTSNRTSPAAAAEKPAEKFDLSETVRLPERFALLNKMILRDLNGRDQAPTFAKYTRDDIQKYIANPFQYENQLRDAVVYLYGASPHFRRLIQYFVGLNDLSYVVAPYRIDTAKAKPKTIASSYRRVQNLLSAMDIKNQFANVLTICLREDVCYVTMWETADNISLQILPSKYCKISTIEGNVCNVTFDFSYFDANSQYLPFYPAEFLEKYNLYKTNPSALKWQELDSPRSFAIKCNRDVLNYAMPPFAGILREIYALEDFKSLKATKTELENYALLVMTLGVNEDGEWQMDLDMAKEFWRNLDGVLPEEVGSVLSPMPINKISFERTHASDDDTVGAAEESLFTAAGVSSLLFNNPKASSNALLLSIKADQALTYGIVKSIEQAVNRFVWAHPYGKNFRVNFLDVSPFNRKEVGDLYLKACQYGIPMISYYAVSQGLPQAEMDTMNFLEQDVLHLTERFKPLQSSATMSSDPGAPEKEVGEISDNGEIAKEGSGDEE